MTNYFGKSRLKKIFYGYISLSPEKKKDFLECRDDYVKSLKDEYECERITCDDFIFRYKRYKGTEWLECSGYKYRYKLWADGVNVKAISIDEYRYYEGVSEPKRYRQTGRVVSRYSKDFIPNPENIDKSLDCYEISKNERS